MKITSEQLAELIRAITAIIATALLAVLVFQSVLTGNPIPDEIVTLLMGLGAFYFLGDSSSAFTAFLNKRIKKD